MQSFVARASFNLGLMHQLLGWLLELVCCKLVDFTYGFIWIDMVFWLFKLVDFTFYMVLYMIDFPILGI